MKIVNILGGLGNQMFQYAFALALKAEFPDEAIKLNTQCFRGYPLHNGLEIDSLFPVDFEFARFQDLCKVSYPWVHYKFWQIGRKILPKRDSMAWDYEFKGKFDYQMISKKKYFDGYWQAPKFFEKHRNSILKVIKFPTIKDEKNSEAISFIKKEKTAFIHIRRGDYVNHPKYGGICTEDYYKNAIHKIRWEYGYSRFLIFSNDQDWCKKNLAEYLENAEVRYVDWNKGKSSYVDMQLMSLCDGGIIANSSFSWWGAWLGPQKLILAPEKWCNVPGHRDDTIPNGWIRIPID